MLYNISESWIFRGVLSCNELRAGREKLSTIGGGETVENFLVWDLHGMIFGRTFASERCGGDVGVCSAII